MNCQICGIEVDIPHSCHYCGGQFCSQHRLPENHTCPQLGNAHNHNSGYNYSFNFNPQPTKTRRKNIFSPKELKHLGIAILLVICIGFSIGVYNSIGSSSTWPISMMAVFAVCIMASFLVHELAHKITAQNFGLWAEFRLTTWGAILTFASIFLPFKMIAPGAMMISGTTDKKSILKISIAGPITNIIFASVFFTLSFALSAGSWQSVVLAYIGYINAFIAIFNLIPFGVFDGYKIFSVNKKIWTIAFGISVILLIYGYLQL